MNLARAFGLVAESHLKKTAVFSGEAEFSYRHFRDQTRWVGGRLRSEFRVQPGDRVAIWLKNCPEYVSAVLGIWHAGGVAVPINNFFKPAEVGYILGDAGVNVLITDRELGEAMPKLRADVPALRAFQIESFAAQSASADLGVEPVNRIPGDLAALIYTSGTTGHPKGAMLTHGNLLHNVESCRQVLEAVNLDRFALVLPMFHSFMLTVCVLLPLMVGGSIVLIKSLHPPKSLLDEITRHQATILAGIPQLFRALARTAVPPDLTLRLCVSGAAPLPLETLREFTERFPIPLIEGYGLSEASPVVSMNPIKGQRKPGSIGLPIANVEVSIRNELGQELPRGTEGEVCVRGGNVMLGYWNLPKASAEALRDGWLYTGDIGRMDLEGYIYITDRKKDMLLVNGINVYPREVEEVIYQFPDIKEAAVIGRPDSRKGEQPVAFVAMNDGHPLDEAALLHFLRDRLADYKVPRHVIQVPALPRNATGKVLKTTLRALPA